MIEALQRIVTELLGAPGRAITIGLDGPSGVGKSTIAEALRASLPAALVPGDDFFAAYLTRAQWEAAGFF
jgi:uridine kinase